MNPNKRGPVEMLLLAMATSPRRRGREMRVAFPCEAPEWYAKEMSDAGADLITVPGLEGNRLRALTADLVHLHFVSAKQMLPIFAGRLPTVRTEHNLFPPVRWPRRLARHLTARWIDRHIAVSAAVAGMLRRDYLLPIGSLRVIHNGVDLTRFRPRPDKLALRARLLGMPASAVVIMVAAHLIPRKQIHMLVEALANLEAWLVIAGAGPERDRLADQIRSLGLSDRARIFSADNDIAAMYAASDIGVLCSAVEAFGGAAIEAMACGLPLVVTPTPGLNEVPEPGVSGVIAADHSPAALANALQPLVSDAELRSRMGAAAMLRVREKFDIRKVADETWAVYDEL